MKQSTSLNNGDAPLTGGMLWSAAIILAIANFIAVLDMTVANVSVPSISGALGATISQGTWVITSYSVAEAITVPLTGWLAARFGAVRVVSSFCRRDAKLFAGILNCDHFSGFLLQRQQEGLEIWLNRHNAAR